MSGGVKGESRPATYAAAGVDIDAGDRAVERIRPMVASTLRPEVIGDLGGFGGLFALDRGRWRDPVLVSGTDGVGTKALVAQAVGRLDTLGIDLVAMCVDDLVCQGAEPLFVLDYISTGSVDPTRMADLVAGVAAGCRGVGATLLGGEMAEHPGVMKPGEFDLVGFAVGVVERARILGAHRVVAGDVLVGLHSDGLRCNGYTLARQVLLDRAGLTLDGPAYDGAPAGWTLADELLRPSLLYAPAVRAAIEACAGVSPTSASSPGSPTRGSPSPGSPTPGSSSEVSSSEGSAEGVHAAAHITGGGLVGNIPRMLPDGTVAVLDVDSWTVPTVFEEIRRLGPVTDQEMARVFNLGLGMVLAVAPDCVDDAVTSIAGAGIGASVVGRIEERPGAGRSVEFVGDRLWRGDEE